MDCTIRYMVHLLDCAELHTFLIFSSDRMTLRVSSLYADPALSGGAL